MIIITGGRSGTSFIAKLYRELGFDPGGEWVPDIDAGFEAEDVRRLNQAIIKDLGLRTLDPARQVPKPAAWLAARMLPARMQRPLASALYRTFPGMSHSRPGSMRWDRFDEAVDKYRATLHEVSRSREVVKDPRFLWTLGVWAGAGAELTHVTVAIRSLDAIVRSIKRSRIIGYRSEASAKNLYAYGLGLCLAALHDHRLSHSFVRYPDMVESPDQLFAALAFPRPVDRERFMHVFKEVARPDLIHDGA